MASSGPNCTTMFAAAESLIPILQGHATDLNRAVTLLAANLSAPEQGANGAILPGAGPRGLTEAKQAVTLLRRTLDHVSDTFTLYDTTVR